MGETALYCRVSTEDQSLNRQQTETYEYATERIGADPSTISVYEDKATRRNTDRDEF